MASGLMAVATGYSLASPPPSRLPTHLYYPFEGSQTLSPLHPPFYTGQSLPSCPFPSLFSSPYLLSSPFPISRPWCPVLRSVQHRVQAPGLAPEAAGYLQGPPPVYRDDVACGMVVSGLILCLFLDMVDTKILLLPPSSSILVPVFATALASVPVLVLCDKCDSVVRWFGRQLTKDTSWVHSPVATRMKTMEKVSCGKH